MLIITSYLPTSCLIACVLAAFMPISLVLVLSFTLREVKVTAAPIFLKSFAAALPHLPLPMTSTLVDLTDFFRFCITICRVASAVSVALCCNSRSF